MIYLRLRRPRARVDEWTGGDRVTTSGNDNDEAEQEDIGEQMGVATDAIREAVLRLFREGEVHPWVVVLAAARVAGELGASAALAGGQDTEKLLGELAGVMRQAGRDQAQTLRAEGLLAPAAGNA